MPRPLLSLGVATAIVVVGIAALDTAARAQAHNPLTGAPVTVRPAPAWQNRSWLNTPGDRPLTLADLRGRVVLLNFWTYTCWNCTGALPSMVAFDSLYRDAGLTIIGIHTPEFPPYGGEHDRGNVAQAITKHHLAYPVAQDNDRRTWDLYDIRYWPSYVLIDRKGQIRFEGYGEFHVGDRWHHEWDGRIKSLLAEGA